MLSSGSSSSSVTQTYTAVVIQGVVQHVAFGFKPPEALIALAMLSLGGYRPTLPGRPVTSRPTDQSVQP